MTISHIPLSSVVTSPNKSAAKNVIERVLNRHLKRANALLMFDKNAALHNRHHDLCIEFTLFSPADIYVRVRQRSVNLLTGRLGAPDSRGLRPLRISKWTRKWESALLADGWKLRPVAAITPKPLIKTRLSKGQKVVNLPRPIELATGRSRANAALAIANNLDQIRRSVGFGKLGEVRDLYRAPLTLNLTQTRGGTYFSVWHDSLKKVMTGYIDPIPRGRYASGRLHPMFWTRGWEAALFDSGQWIEISRSVLTLP